MTDMTFAFDVDEYMPDFPAIDSGIRNEERGMRAVSNSLGLLLGPTNGATRTLLAILPFVAMAGDMWHIYEGARHAMKAAAMRNYIAASFETAVYAIGQQWHSIAMATGASVYVAAAFSVGHYIGEVQGREEEVRAKWDSPEGRRKARAIIASGGG